MRALADGRLTELQGAQQETIRLRSLASASAHFALSDDNVKSHAAYRQLASKAQEVYDECNRAKTHFANVRAEAQQAVALRQSEAARFEEQRSSQQRAADDTAKYYAAALAAAASERRSILIELSKVKLAMKREEDRLADLDGRLRSASSEAERRKAEAARQKGQQEALRAERNAAHAEGEASRQKAHALELKLGAFEAPLAPDEAQAKLQETLVKLGAAEQAAAVSRAEVSSLQGAQDAMMAEVETVSQTYEEVQARNDALQDSLTKREEVQSRMAQAKHKAEAASAMKQSELDSTRDKMNQLARLTDTTKSLREAYEARLQKSVAASSAKDAEISAHSALLDKKSAELREAESKLGHATTALAAGHAGEAKLREGSEALGKEVAEKATHAKRLEAERDALSRRVARLSAKDSGGGVGGDSDAQEQLEFYRAKVKCTLCRTNDKDTIINKCGHTFCRECIQKRLDLRNRKCPSCALQFDFQAVKDMYLTA